jgi:2-dehydropantoate 2-reductase
MEQNGPILIAGAGAIGSVMGGMLHTAGHEIAMLGRRSHLDAIARDGLHLTGLFGERIVRGFTLAERAEELGRRFEVVLLTAKSFDTAAIAAELSPVLAPGGIIVSMQNGVGNIETLVERFGASRVLGGRVIFGAEMESPGVVRVTVFAEPVAVGPAPYVQGVQSAGLLERARAIATILTSAGIPTDACADVMPYLWTKLFYNAALNPLGALLGLHYGALAEDPDLRAIMDDAIGEAFAVARRMDVALPFKDADAYRSVFYGKLLPSTFHHRPTMLYDLERRGRTDVAELNGKVVELAARFGLDAPVNAMLTRLVRARERLQKERIENP